MDNQPLKIVTVNNVPPDLWHKLKIKAITDGDTLQAAFRKAVQRYVEEAA